MQIDNKKVDLFYDLIDKACMIYYNDIKRDYLEAFISFTNALINGLDEPKLSSKAVQKLEKIINQISSQDFLNEEVRLAVELVLIKGYKHRNLLLDFLTPDGVSYIFSFIVNSIINNDPKYKDLDDDDFDEVVVMDTVMGAGNMLNTIINNGARSITGIGIERDILLANLAKSLAEIIDNDIIVNVQDAKIKFNALADIIVGDFGETEDVYDIILARLDNILNNGYFAYMVNNDFFTKATNEFKEALLKEATLMGLIVLPSNFVKKGHVGKSIIVGKKEILKDYQMSIISIDENLSDMNNVAKKINKMFE